MDGEHIVGVAIEYPDGVKWLPRGARHHHLMQSHMQYTGKATSGECEQGFWTNTQRFVSRFEAMKIASKAGQVSETKAEFNTYLYSEDLW